MKSESKEVQKAVFRPLKRKLLFAVVIVSTVLTSLVVFFHFKFEYKRDVTLLNEKIEQLNISALPAISKAIWNEDTSYLQLQTESLAKLSDIEKIKITDSSNKVIAENVHIKEAGAVVDARDLRIYNYPLLYTVVEGEKPQLLGTVEITATLTNVKMDIYKRLAFFIAAQFLKTFFISWIILLVFHHYINKNIEQIIDFVQTFNLNSVDETYLNLKRKTKTRDELTLLQDSINRMIKKIHFLNREKEEKINQQEKKLEVQKKSALTNSKMAALGEMAGGIAHEINTPLNAIQAKTKIMEKMIEKGIQNNELFLENTQSIIGTVDHITNVVKGLKNISQDASDEIKHDAMVGNLLGNIFNLCEEKLKNNNIELNCDLENNYFKIHLNCFPIQLSQVFLILMNNSFDSLENKENKWIKIEASQNKKWLFMHFIDSGDGIDKRIREKIFQPFFTTKDLGKGSGLGLSLAAEIIKKHGGELFYDDHYKNTCFTIKLLLKERKSILVVDDDIDIREAICSYLQLEGYNTIEATSGKEALNIIKEKQIEFVVSDIRMPDGGGLYLVDELRKVDRLLPYVILVTGQADISREEAIKRGALDLLKKPLEMDRIIGLIKYIENSYDDFVEM